MTERPPRSPCRRNDRHDAHEFEVYGRPFWCPGFTPASSPPADQTGLRDRIAEALIAWTYRGKDPEHGGILETVRANAYSRADAVLAVLPAPTDQAAVLRAAAAFFERTLEHSLDPDSDPRYCTAIRDVVMGLRRRADETAATETQATAPAETDEERADREETERDHARGDHTHCGLTCEVQMPTEHLRNFVIAKGYPGTKGALDELLRRARAEAAAVLPAPADRAELDSLGREADRLRKDWVEMRTRAEHIKAEVEQLRADRAAALREVESALSKRAMRLTGEFNDSDILHEDGPAATVATWKRAAEQARRMADETATTETQAGAPGRRQTVEYFVQSQQPDGTWESASSFSTDLDFAAARLAARREKMPDLTLRLAERTTTVAVRALPDCLSCRHWSCDGTGECGALLDAWQRCDCTGPAAGARQDGAQP